MDFDDHLARLNHHETVLLRSNNPLFDSIHHQEMLLTLYSLNYPVVKLEGRI